MSRSLAEWVAKSDNAPIPPRVRLRVFERYTGRCAECMRKLTPGDHWETDHRTALINGGKHCESNLQLLCAWCHASKTSIDVAIKSKTYAIRSKHIGIKRTTSRPLPGTRASGWKHKMSGEWVRR